MSLLFPFDIQRGYPVSIDCSISLRYAGVSLFIGHLYCFLVLEVIATQSERPCANTISFSKCEDMAQEEGEGWRGEGGG